jgi:hypothetical protein
MSTCVRRDSWRVLEPPEPAKAWYAKHQQKHQVAGSTTAVVIIILIVVRHAVVAGAILGAATSEVSGNRIDIRVGETSEEAH